MEEKVSVMTEKKKSIILKTEFSVHREYFFTHRELFRYHHWKQRETCIWSGSAPCSLLVKPYPPKSGLRGTLIRRGTLISFMEGATLKWTKSFLISRIMYGKKFHENTNWSKSSLRGPGSSFSYKGRLKLKSTARSSEDRPITSFIYQTLSSDSRTINSIGIGSRR